MKGEEHCDGQTGHNVCDRRVHHVSHPARSVLSSERDLDLCGEEGLGGLLKVELLDAVECRGESES